MVKIHFWCIGEKLNPQENSAWDNFWRATAESAAYKRQSPLEQVLARFWTKLFIERVPVFARPRLLDLACGNGVVTQFMHDAIAHLGAVPRSVHCLDISPAAIAAVTARFSSVVGTVSDAKHTPLEDRNFDIVASQFGLEYAGIEAFAEAGRLVAEPGILVLIVHLKDGAVYRENLSNQRAVTLVQQSHVLACFAAFADASFSVRRGHGGAERMQQADQRLALAVKELENVLNTYGLNIAGGALFALHSDLAHMYGRLHAYRPEELHTWINNNTAELRHYAGRMTSMLDAAMDAESIASAIDAIERCGLSVTRNEAIVIGAEPAAWVLMGTR